MNEWIVAVLLVALALCIAGLGLLFVRNALKQFRKSGVDGFKTILFVQKNYDKIRKSARIPCSVLYIKATTQEKMTGMKEERRTHQVTEHLSEMLLATFGDRENMIARFANHDFVVLTRMSETKLMHATEQIIHEMLLFSKVNAQTPQMQISFGAYLIPASSINFEEAVARARLACLEAKESGITYLAWDYNLQREHDSKQSLERHFRSGIEQNNFFLEFQPIIDISTGAIVAGEVLTRLSADSRVILPADFVPVLHGQDMSAEFDYYIFKKTCQWAALHPELCARLKHISINISRSTLARADVAEKLFALAEKYQIARSFLAIEVLEDQRGSRVQIEQVKRNITRLKQMGFPLLLDDFGEGFTSFDDLQNYPVDCIKISKTIVSHINTQIGLRIFHSVLNIAKNIGVSVICEGAETLSQIEILRESGCKLVQGFYFYCPLSAEQFARVVENDTTSEGES